MIPVMPLTRLKLSAVALAVVLAAGAASAQTPLPVPDPLDARDARRVERMERVVRELRSIVFQLRDTGKPVVVQPADADARMADLATKLSDLEQTLVRMNGSLEAVTNELSQARRANTDLQNQVRILSDRIAAQEQTQTASIEPGPAPGPAGSGAGEAFTRARQLMMGGQYDEARAAFADFVADYPDDTRTPEAQYWLGKTLAVRNANVEAAGAYISAIRGWPQTAWAPDAVVELARSLIVLKKPSDACTALGEFKRRYPKAPAAVASRAAQARTQAKCA